MTELKKDIDTILLVIETYFNKEYIVYNEESNMIGCPSCFINYYENEWVLSINHSYVNDSSNIEDCVNLSLDLVANGINIKTMPGCFVVLDDYDIINESNEFSIIDAYDVWEYCDKYGVSEDFALTALTARLMEDKLKESMN